MWLVQRFYQGGCEFGSRVEPFFVTTDWELAHTSVAVMNHNLHQAKALAKQYPRHPRVGSTQEWEEYVKLREAHDAQVEALVLEYDPQEGSTDISYYEIVEIEVR